MNITEFLSNHTCPMCGKGLTLFLRARKNSLWKATPTAPNGFMFEQFLLKSKTLKEKDAFIMDFEDGRFNITCNSSELRQEIKTWQFFIYYICNEKAITQEWEQHKINVHDACYFRNSVHLEFHPQKNEVGDTIWELQPVNKELVDPTRLENFTLTQTTESKVEKVYFLTLDSENKKTILRHYTVSPEQNKDSNFEPNVFEKTMPMMTVRPDLNDKTRLMERLDSWILMS
jgi:hypothetical protein